VSYFRERNVGQHDRPQLTSARLTISANNNSGVTYALAFKQKKQFIDNA